MPRNIRLFRMLIFGFVIIFMSSQASAESLEGFLKQIIKAETTANMYHPNGQYMQFIGTKELTFNKEKILQFSEHVRSMGTQTEILDFKVLNKYESGDIVSVVIWARVQQSVGSTKAIGEVVSHELLMKKNGSYVSVFSIGKQ